MVTRDDFYCTNKVISASYYKGLIHAFPHMSESFSSNLTQFFSLAFWIFKSGHVAWMFWMFCYTAGWHVVIQYELTWYIFHWSAQLVGMAYSIPDLLFSLQVGRVQQRYRKGPDAEFLDEIQTKDLRAFLLVIQSPLYSFALRFIFLQKPKP